MSSNKTPNLQLPQFAAKDHPDFLTDFNDAFKKLDEVIGGLSTSSGASTVEITALKQSIEAMNTAITDLTARVVALENKEA